MNKKIDCKIKNVLINRAKKRFPEGITNIHENIDDNFTKLCNEKKNITIISYWYNDKTMSSRIESIEIFS